MRWSRPPHHCRGGAGRDEIQLLPTLWHSTGTRCSRCCDGSFARRAGYDALKALAVVACVVRGAPVPASFAVVYAASDCGAAPPTSGMEVVRAVLAVAVATTAAGHPGLSFFVWLAFIAAFVHVTRAALFMEMELLADCARCCNEAHRCTCGRRKRAIPPGALSHLAVLVQQQWRARAQRLICEL